MSAQTLGIHDDASIVDFDGHAEVVVPNIDVLKKLVQGNFLPSLRRPMRKLLGTWRVDNEGKQGGRENIDRSGLDELEDHDILKPQKLTPPLGGRAALSGNNGQLRHSPSVISEDGEYDGPERISDDRNSGDLSVSNEGSSHL
ncbi:hypothetical protein V1520DRAFT_358485 [Lipomyces starkeyi]